MIQVTRLKIFFQALRTAEQLAGDDEEMNEVVTELKQLMGLTGDSVTQGLRTLLSDNNSALSRTMGHKLRNSMNKDNLKSGGKLMNIKPLYVSLEAKVSTN